MLKKKQTAIVVQLCLRAAFVALVLVWFAFPSFAQNASPAAAQKPTVMWKVTDASGKTAYLLGSIHLGRKEFYPFPAEVEDAFAAADKLLVEIDISSLNKDAVKSLVLANGVYSGADTLFKHLSPLAQEKLKKVSAESRLSYQNFAKLKPWLVALTISVAPAGKDGYLTEYGVDRYFLEKARGKKQIVEIESAESQVKLFTDMTDKQQIEYLESTLSETEKLSENSQKLVAAWQSGDPQRIEAMLTPESGISADFRKKLLDDRNPRMVDFTAQCIKNDERCFVVVGAGHIVGANGMVQLLKDRGYKVEQVFAAPDKK